MKDESATPGELDLSSLIFSAKIDYVSIHTPGKLALPELQGKPRWARKLHWKRLTVHDPVSADIHALAASLEQPRLAELEVSVDVRCNAGVPALARRDVLEAVMVGMFAMQLHPQLARHVDLSPAGSFRGAYRRTESGYQLRPFNMSLPSPTDQQLHGLRTDPIQTKAYLKTIDQRAPLSQSKHVARVEVRLSGEGLSAHGLELIGDLTDFRFRKHLMPYFRHVKGTRVRALDREDLTPLQGLLSGKLQELHEEEWKKAGIGAFIGRGRFAERPGRALRNTEVNDRIAQSLGRLERQMKTGC